MLIKTMDAFALKKCFLAGAGALNARKEEINDLNVFPVPDGDTGTNMTMTIMSAVNEVQTLENAEMKSLCKAISGGSLRGARGNSGVILSQLLRGFTKEISEKKEIDVPVLARAFERAVEAAYKAVMKPKEGTILTVARAGADRAGEMADQTDNLAEFGNAVLMHMQDVLEQTPEMLPVLKEAGVVDSGGEGLLTILRGAYNALIGKETPEVPADPEWGVTGDSTKIKASQTSAETEIRFGYCTEFIIMPERTFTEKDEKDFKVFLKKIGDSIVCVADEDLVKVHVHTNDPGLAIQEALSYGQLSRMKIDNMREEHNERLIKNASKLAEIPQVQAEPVHLQAESEMGKPDFTKVAEVETKHKENAFVSVSAGEGLGDLFRELGCDVIIEGGQTMNPSTEDILKAVHSVSADYVYIFPNNSNIVLAAEQAGDMVKDKKVIVIPSKNIPQGIAAMIAFVEGSSWEENKEAMNEALADVKAGQVTYAVRDTNIDGKEIKTGDIIGLSDKTIEVSGKNVVETTAALIKKMLGEESELVTIYYGEEGTEEEAEKIAEMLQEEDGPEVEIEYGGQPIYYYLVSVE